jgi:deoxyribonuclease V
MKAQQLHNWSVTPGEAKRIQLNLAAKVSTRNTLGDVHSISGVDISAPDSQGMARAAVVVLNYPELSLIEVKVVEQKVTFPYVPGLLSFRESPLIISACEGLVTEPDLVLVDGQGIAHPRKFGLASHLGLLWDKPTIGCAKSRLCGEHSVVSVEKGSYAEIMYNSEVIGAALRTRHGVAPMYISAGHRMDLPTAITWVLRCCKSVRMPEPTRLAHQAAGGHIQEVQYNDIGRNSQISLFK